MTNPDFGLNRILFIDKEIFSLSLLRLVQDDLKLISFPVDESHSLRYFNKKFVKLTKSELPTATKIRDFGREFIE